MPGHVTGSVGPGDGSVEATGEVTSQVPPRATVRRLRPPAGRTSGRERHEEKITVYVASEELFAIEQARLVLRAEHGIAADRGHLIREAMAEMLIDLEAHGENSAVVRRLRPS